MKYGLIIAGGGPAGLMAAKGDGDSLLFSRASGQEGRQKAVVTAINLINRKTNRKEAVII